jgi:hypothetical protein
MRDSYDEHIAIDPGSKWPLLILLLAALLVADYMLVRHVEGQRAARAHADNDLAVNGVSNETAPER